MSPLKGWRQRRANLSFFFSERKLCRLPLPNHWDTHPRDIVTRARCRLDARRPSFLSQKLSEKGKKAKYLSESRPPA